MMTTLQSTLGAPPDARDELSQFIGDQAKAAELHEGEEAYQLLQADLVGQLLLLALLPGLLAEIRRIE